MPQNPLFAESLLQGHSDKGKTHWGLNAGLKTRLSEWPLILLGNHAPLNQRVPGSSPGAPTKQVSLFANGFAGSRPRTKRVSCDVFCGRTSHGRIAVRPFLRFSIFSFVSVPSPHLVERADLTVQVEYALVAEWDIGARKTDDLFCLGGRCIACCRTGLFEVGLASLPPRQGCDFVRQSATSPDGVRQATSIRSGIAYPKR